PVLRFGETAVGDARSPVHPFERKSTAGGTTMRTRMWALSGAIAAVALLAACGQKTGASPGGGSGSSPMAEHLGTRSISGIGTVLDNAQGLTLYHLKTETNGHIQCTGSCATTWPPMLAAGGSAPAAPSGVSGTFG